MILRRVNRTFHRFNKSIVRGQKTQAAHNQDEYTETPEYPPIVDLSLQARKLRERQAIYENIKKLETVEEKQIGLNMPRYYGFKCVLFNENKVPYNAMPLVQCYTRSHFIKMDTLPECYSETVTAADELVKEISSAIENALVIENEGVERNITAEEKYKPEAPQIEDQKAKYVVRQINRIIMNKLSDQAPHIVSGEVDYDPRHEAFWFVGGTDVPRAVISWRNKYPWLWDRKFEPVDRALQYIGKPLLALRYNVPLKPIIPYGEAENPAFKVPKFSYVPISVGYFDNVHRHGTNIPGYWPGDLDEYGLLSYHGRGHILARKESFGEQDNIEALHCQAMKSSFGWLLAQANYQGFTTYNDVTYPLVTQTIITNGNLFSFYVYQLNTIIMHNEQMDENPKHNVCFGTKPMKLYDTIENGQVKGLNQEVLKTLVQFYLNAPEKREHEMKPYLNENQHVVAEIENDKKRIWLENRYKLMVSNRPRHRLVPEVYHWEKIYKIYFDKRFQERKVRPFERGINPFKRRLDEHRPPYIPKHMRPYPKHGLKFEHTYYPKV